MAILPIRDLGSAGVISDVSSYNIPINAFNHGFNVRFDEGKVSRAPYSATLKTRLASALASPMGLCQLMVLIQYCCRV
jgi:hypothetical protein